MTDAKSGYVSKDTPHNVYYRQEPIRKVDVSKSLYETVRELNKDNMDYPAIGYMGKEWSYRQLLQLVDKAASAFQNAGVKQADEVAVSLINIPEAAVILLALNKIGAVSKWLDVRLKGGELQHYLTDSCQLIVIMDFMMESVKEILPQTGINRVLVCSPGDSLPFPKSLLFRIANRAASKMPSKQFERFSDFIESNQNPIQADAVSFSCNAPSVIVQSSGTTGIAKLIVHTNYTFNVSIYKWCYFDMPMYAGKTLLATVPPWIAYGLANSTYLSLALGLKVEMCPKVDEFSVFENIGRFDMSFAAPLHYRYLADNINKVKNMSRIECLATGGDKITKDELQELRRIFKTKGFNGEIINGYGNNECLGGASCNPMHNNKEGTVGIPFYGNTIAAFDSDTLEELKYNEIGELCIRTETAFLEYSGNMEETNRIKRMHKDGQYWIHTGDLGSVDEDGYITITGRLRRVIIRTAFKIYPGTIEKAILSLPDVSDCVVVGVNDKADLQVPMAFVAVSKDCPDSESEIRQRIVAKCSEVLKDYENPKYIQFIDKIPYTDNNKQDFRKLEDMGNDYVESIING